MMKLFSIYPFISPVWALLPVAAALAYCGLRLLLPILRRQLLVTPVERSSHSIPTPQGGGLVIVPVSVLLVLLAILSTGALGYKSELVLGCLAALCVLGALDDKYHLSARLRFLAQSLIAFTSLNALPLGWDALIPLPAAATWLLAIIALVWMINLTNFMDGLDWMVVCTFVPAMLTCALALWGSDIAPLAIAFCGALIGFAPFNRPVAKLFLGDSGSLPLGLLAGVLCITLIARWGWATGLLPFAYFISDATITLLRRLLRREKIWQAHRSHFYQIATTRGLSTAQVIARVTACNLALCGLALFSVGETPERQLLLLIVGGGFVWLLLRDLARHR